MIFTNKCSILSITIGLFNLCWFAIIQIECAPNTNKYSLANCNTDPDSIDAPDMQPNQNLVNCSLINPLLANCTCANDYIDCSNKGFYSIPTNLTNLPIDITRLLFANNFIQSLDEQIQFNNLTQIIALDLKQNQIKKINETFFDSTSLADSLEFLSFCINTNINDFNLVNANFSKLRHLQMNYLDESLKINDGLFTKERFPLLNILEANNADLKLDKLPFDRLDNLEILYLDSNNLTEYPCDSLLSLTGLQILNLNNNSLSKQTKFDRNCLQNLNELTSLYLKSNDLREEHLQWLSLYKFKYLEKLDLKYNKFTKIPYEALQGLKSLNTLLITINESRFTPPTVKQNQIIWENLTYLDLSSSSINNLPSNSFALFSKQLTDLYLKNCGIKFIEADAFGKLNCLIILDLSNNDLRSLFQPSNKRVFDYSLLLGNLILDNNTLECNQDIEWFLDFYNYTLFNKNLTCSSANGTKILILEYLNKNRSVPVIPPTTDPFNILAVILVVLIVLALITVVTYFVRRKHVKKRQQQYRYRYFTERSQDDGFDTDNIPVYRDCTVSLRIKDTDDNTNFNNTNSIIDSSTAALTEQRDVIN